jgi:hypothetical protein
MGAFWTALAFAASLLQLAIIWLMQTRGFYIRYPLLFLYVITSWLAAIVEWAAFGWENYARYYWTNELILQTLIFLTMMQFIYYASGGGRWRMVGLIAAGAAAAVLLSVAFYSEPPRPLTGDRQTTYVMTQLSRNLSFCSALLNLVLWNALLRAKRKDVQLLMLSAGLGILTAGKAIGHSLRVLSKESLVAGNAFVVVSALLSFAIWFWTFRNVKMAVGGQVVPAGTAGTAGSAE